MVVDTSWLPDPASTSSNALSVGMANGLRADRRRGSGRREPAPVASMYCCSIEPSTKRM